MGMLSSLANSTTNCSAYLRNNSPKLLSTGSLIFGIGAVGATAYATWMSKDIIEEHNLEIQCMHDKLEKAEDEKQKDEIKTDILKLYLKTGSHVALNFTPAATLLAGSVACNRLSTVQYENKIKHLKEELAVGAAAYALLKSSFDKAKERAEEKYGKEEAADIFYGSTEKEVEVEEKGKKKKIVKVKEYDPYGILNSNPCSILLGDGIESNLEEGKENLWYNISFIKSLENKYTYILNSKGYVLVQDIYKELGLSPSNKFQHDIWASYGWIKDTKKIDNYIEKCRNEGIEPTEEGKMMANSISLGLDNFVNERYVSGLEPTVWIIPNCIGDIMPFLYEDGNYVYECEK